MDKWRGLSDSEPAAKQRCIRHIIHSFDPCVACAGHLAGSGVDHSIDVKVL